MGPGDQDVHGRSLGAAKVPDVISALAAHPSWPYFIPKRFYRELLGFDPAPDVLQILSAAWGPAGDLKALLTAIVNQPEFLSDQAVFSKVKQPVELVASAARLLGFKSLAAANFYLASNLHQLVNQHPLYAPNVSGWPRGDQWLGAGALLAWSQLAGTMVMTGFNWAGVATGPINPYVQRLFSEGPAADRDNAPSAPGRVRQCLGDHDGQAERVCGWAGPGRWRGRRA